MSEVTAFRKSPEIHSGPAALQTSRLAIDVKHHKFE